MMRVVRLPGLEWAHLVACVLLALILAVVVRSATAELSRSVGSVWPFSAVHCDAPKSPGCAGEARLASARQPGAYGSFAR